MEYYNNRLCISMRDLVSGGVMTESAYQSLVKRRQVDVVRRGCRGSAALVAVSSLPERYQSMLRQEGKSSADVLHAWFRKNYEIDQQAVVWYNRWATTQKGATQKHVQEYITNASVLNTVVKLYNSSRAILQTMGGDKFEWDRMQEAVEYYRAQTGHTLPESMLRFRKRVMAYKEQGYESLLSGKWGNQNTRKVNHQVERLVLAIAIGMYIYLKYSKQGYEITVVGDSENTARYAGINVKKVTIRTMAISGAICGLAGFIAVAGASHTISTTTAGGRGFTAIIVAWLAQFNSFVMILISFLLVFLQKGAIRIASQFNLNDYASNVITGIILFFILGSEFFINYRIIFRGGKEAAK